MKITIKNKFWKVFVMDILFIIIFIGVFFFIRKSLISYVGVLELLQGNLQSISSTNIEQASNVIQSLSRSATKAYIYTFILAPLILFLVYVLIQGFSWKIANKRDKTYFLKFGLISIPFYIFLILFSLGSLKSVTYGILIFISGYFAFVFYIHPSLDMIKNSFKKLYLFLPMYLLFIIIFSLYLFSGFLAFISLFIGNYSVMLPFSVVITIIFSFYKLFLIEKFE